MLEFLGILIMLAVAAAVGIAVYKRRKRIREKAEDAWESFKDEIGV